MSPLLQTLAAALILEPFALLQLDPLRPDSRAYLLPNLVGSAALAALALAGTQWGFPLLERRPGRLSPHGG